MNNKFVGNIKKEVF